MVIKLDDPGTFQFPGEVSECGALICLQTVLSFQMERLDTLRKETSECWREYCRSGAADKTASFDKYVELCTETSTVASTIREIGYTFELRYPEDYLEMPTHEEKPAKRKPTICLDFDGVIHRYSRGWQGGQIYDTPTEGFREWAIEARQHFNLVIYSSRSASAEGIEAMKAWLTKHGFDIKDFSFAHTKPPAFITIDDRALTFDGDWSLFKPTQLLTFKSWCSQ